MTDQATPATGVDGQGSSTSEAETAEQLWAEFDAADAGETGQSRSQTRVSEVDEEGEETPDFPDEDDAKDEKPDLDADGKKAASAKTDDPKPTNDDRDAQIERLQHQLSSERGRREAAQRELTKLQQRIADGAQDITERKRSLTASDKRKAEIEKAKKDYPDAVAPLAAEIEANRAKEQREIKRQEKQLDDDRAELNARLEENQGKFLEEHPDGFDFVKEHWDVFKDWIEDQPRNVREGFNQNRKAIVDPVGAALTVAKFKAAMAKQGVKPSDAGKGKSADPQKPPLDGKRQRQLQGAQAPRTTKPLRTQSAPSDDASPEDHWAYFEQLDREKEAASR